MPDACTLDAPAGTVFIQPGSSPGDGTPARPFTDLNDAVASLVSGGTLRIAPGEYWPVSLDDPLRHSGTVIEGCGGTPRLDGLLVLGSVGARLAGIEVRDVVISGAGAMVANAEITMSGVTFDKPASGLVVASSTVQLDGLVVVDADWHGLAATDSEILSDGPIDVSASWPLVLWDTVVRAPAITARAARSPVDPSSVIGCDIEVDHFEIDAGGATTCLVLTSTTLAVSDQLTATGCVGFGLDMYNATLTAAAATVEMVGGADAVAIEAWSLSTLELGSLTATGGGLDAWLADITIGGPSEIVSGRVSLWGDTVARLEQLAVRDASAWGIRVDDSDVALVDVAVLDTVGGDGLLVVAPLAATFEDVTVSGSSRAGLLSSQAGGISWTGGDITGNGLALVDQDCTGPPTQLTGVTISGNLDDAVHACDGTWLAVP